MRITATCIVGCTCPPTFHSKIIKRCDKRYYKVRHVNLLQSARVFLLIKCDSCFITNFDKCYYKVRHFYWNKKATTITKSPLLRGEHFFYVYNIWKANIMKNVLKEPHWMIEKCVNNILVTISNIFTKVDRRNTLPLN